MRARGKDEVLPQPDGSILSGGTVIQRTERKMKIVHQKRRQIRGNYFEINRISIVLI